MRWVLAVVGIVGCAKPVDAPTTKPPSAVTASVAATEPACVVELGDAATLLGGTVSLRSIEGAPLTSGPQTAQFTGPGLELCGATLDRVSLLRFPHDGSRTVEAVHAQFVEELEGPLERPRSASPTRTCGMSRTPTRPQRHLPCSTSPPPGFPRSMPCSSSSTRPQALSSGRSSPRSSAAH